MTYFKNIPYSHMVHYSRTALHWAAKRNQTPVVQLLVNLGADKCAKTSDGRAALDLATDTTVRQLLDGGDGELLNSDTYFCPS